MEYTVAVIGAGEDPENRDRTGYAMAYRHASGYERLDNVSLVACADIVRENAAAFAENYGLPQKAVYEDYQHMLEREDIDIVSVCTPPTTHAEIVTGSAASGRVDAIHCEKPMATTWADCKRMVEVCERFDVQFTIDHQRRFADPFQKAKELLEEGTIGELQRIECGEVNLFDAGVHQFDMCRHMVDDAAAEWMFANVDYREENKWFGAYNETQAIANWQYENGVTGLAMTGEADDMGTGIIDCYMRLVGTDGVIEIGVTGGPSIRYRVDGQGWTTPETADTINGPKESLMKAGVRKMAELAPVVDSDSVTNSTLYERAVAEVVEALAEHRRPLIAAEDSLNGTELAFAAWESARRRGRIDLPLTIEGNPLEEMIEAGVFEIRTNEADMDVTNEA